MIAELVRGQLKICSSLTEALSLARQEKPRIAAVGAGGKTTLLKRLAGEYQVLDKKPVVITTTHMKAENFSGFLIDPSAEEIMEVLEREGCVFAGDRAKGDKIKILPPKVLEAVLDLPGPVLIEADGARRLPVKIPAKHEPVFLPQVTCVLSVYGLDAVGKRIGEVCFRAELAADFLQKDVEDTLKPEDIAMLAISSRAGRKGAVGHMEYVVVLNKVDTRSRQETALDVWREIEKRRLEYGLGEVKVLITSECAENIGDGLQRV